MQKLWTTICILSACLVVAGAASADGNLKFEASLSGAQEVTLSPGGVVTNTTGEIDVEFDAAFTQAAFELRVFDGVAVTQAHFHCGRAGQNGPVVAFLFGFVVGGINVDGILAAGTLTNASFTGVDCVPVVGRPVNNIASLAFAARDGLIYANAHTVAHPPGEVRGQLLGDND